MASERNIDLVIRAKNDASRAIKDVERDLKKLANSGSETKAKTGAIVDILGSLTDNLKRIGKNSNSFDAIKTASDSAKSSIVALESALVENTTKLQSLENENVKVAETYQKVKIASEAAQATYQKEKQKLKELNDAKLAQQASGDYKARSRESQAQNAEIAKQRELVRQARAEVILTNGTLREQDGIQAKILNSIDRTSLSISRQNSALASTKSLIGEINNLMTSMSSKANQAQSGFARMNNNYAQSKFSSANASQYFGKSAESSFKVFETAGLTNAAPKVSFFQNVLRNLNQTFGEINPAARQAAAGIREVGDGSRQSLSYVQRLRGELLSMVTSVFGVYSAFTQANAALDAYNKRIAMINSLNVAYNGNAEATRAEMQFIMEQANRLGIAINDMGSSYTKFAIAASAANVSQENTRKIFLSVAEAGRVMNLEATDMNGIFLALTQMMSKGKISAEELRGQLGERLPGAFNLMADAIGVSTGELNKMLEKGEVLATEDTFIRFADKLTAKFGGQLPNAINSLSADLGRLRNNWQQSLFTIADSGFADAISYAAKTLNEFLSSAEGQVAMQTLGHELANLVITLTDFTKWITNSGRNLTLLTSFIRMFVSLKVAQEVISWTNSVRQWSLSLMTAQGELDRTAMKARVASGVISMAMAVAVFAIGSLVTAHANAKQAAIENDQKARELGVTTGELAQVYNLAAQQAGIMAGQTATSGSAASQAKPQLESYANSIDRIGTAAALSAQQIRAMSLEMVNARIMEVQRKVKDAGGGLNSPFGLLSGGGFTRYQQTVNGAESGKSLVLRYGTPSQIAEYNRYGGFGGQAKQLEIANQVYRQLGQGKNPAGRYNSPEALRFAQSTATLNANVNTVNAGNAELTLLNQQQQYLQRGGKPQIQNSAPVQNTTGAPKVTSSGGSGGKKTKTPKGPSASEIQNQNEREIAYLADLQAKYEQTFSNISNLEESNVADHISAIEAKRDADIADARRKINNQTRLDQAIGLINTEANLRIEQARIEAQKKEDDYLKDSRQNYLDFAAQVSGSSLDIWSAEKNRIDNEETEALERARKEISNAEILAAELLRIQSEYEERRGKAVRDSLISEMDEKNRAFQNAKQAYDNAYNLYGATDSRTIQTKSEMESLVTELLNAAEAASSIWENLTGPEAEAARESIRQTKTDAASLARTLAMNSMGDLQDSYNNAKTRWETNVDKFGAGDSRSVEARKEMEALAKQISAAADAAERMWSSMSGPEAEHARESIRKAREDVESLRTTSISVGQINDRLASIGTTAFDKWAEAIANGENSIQAFGDAFRLEAANFLREIAMMIIKQQLLNFMQSQGWISDGVAKASGWINNSTQPYTGTTPQPAPQGANSQGFMPTQTGEQIGVQIANSMGSQIANGGIGNMIGAAIGNPFAGILINLMSSVFGGFGGMGGGQGGGSSLPGMILSFGKSLFGFHGGGLPGIETGSFSRTINLISALPKYHGGGIIGLKQNEQLSITEHGEGVFTKAQMAAMGGSKRPQVKVVNAIDAGDFISSGLNSSKGEDSFMNFIQSRKKTIKSILE